MLAERVKEWNKESMQKGIQKGMQKGIQKGIQKGKAEILIAQLNIKFGPISETVQAKCYDASEALLEQWSANILTAKTIGDVFGN